jgi:membrane associated rhomboid family serine protease
MFNFSITPVVKNLLILNLIVFVIDHFVFPLTNMFGLRYIMASTFYPFQFFTYLFLHADFSHVFFNMFALFMFGPLLERFWGPKKFLIFYVVTGLGAGFIYSCISYYQMYDLHQAILTYTANPSPDGFTIFMSKYANGMYYNNYTFINAFAENPTSENYISESIEFMNQLFYQKSNVPMIGASGSVFGVLMAFGMLFPNSEMYIFPLPVPIKAWIYVTIYGIIELYSGVRGAEGDNTAHFAHIGGMIFAYLLIRIWKENRNDFY